jgi:hypothetical protein
LIIPLYFPSLLSPCLSQSTCHTNTQPVISIQLNSVHNTSDSRIKTFFYFNTLWLEWCVHSVNKSKKGNAFMAWCLVKHRNNFAFLSLFLIKHYNMESCPIFKHYELKTFWGIGCIASYFLNFGTRWRWVVSLTPRPLYPSEKRPRYTLDKRLGAPQNWSGRGDEWKESHNCPRWELIPGGPAGSLVAIPTELPYLLPKIKTFLYEEFWKTGRVSFYVSSLK